MASRISLMNEALAQLPTAPIVTEEENSPAAREVVRYFDRVVAELLEIHDWGFATKRSALAVLTNDREDEWAYAYAVPGDMGTPRMVIPDLESLGLSIPVEGPFTPPYYEVWAGIDQAFGPTFIIEGGKVYTNIEDATLEYGRSTIEPASMPALFQQAVVMELASRIAMPVKKDRALKADLIKEAEAAKARAMADDENRHPRQFPRAFTSEAAIARGAY